MCTGSGHKVLQSNRAGSCGVSINIFHCQHFGIESSVKLAVNKSFRKNSLYVLFLIISLLLLFIPDQHPLLRCQQNLTLIIIEVITFPLHS